MAEEEVFIFPASFAQQRLWFLEQLVPDTCFYNVPTILRLVGAIALPALERSVNEIARRHEILRTTFSVVDGQPVQVIAPYFEIALPLIDLRKLPAGDRDATARQLINQDMQRPFNLAQGPLFRVLLIQLDDTEFILLINLHHIIFDEWSSGVLIQELGTLYAAFSAGHPSPLPELPIQYADFAHWQREWLQGEILETQLAYWQHQLNDVPELELPRDRPRPSRPTHRGTTQQIELPQSLTDALEALSQQTGVTLFMTLLAAFQVLLHRYTGQEDIAVGSPIANRNRSELENLIGFFVNSLVLRTDLSGNPTFREVLERVREVTLAAYAHQDLPFEKLVEKLQPERKLSFNPLFQVVFALQNAPMEQLELPGLTLSALNFETQTTRFDLELYLWKCSDNFRSLWGNGWNHTEGLRGVMVYNTDLFEQETIARLLNAFQTLLVGIVTHPDQRLSDLPVLTLAEQQQLLVEWNNTQTPYPRHTCIHHLFEAQVERSPDAIAVQFKGQSFTYRALNQGSNQLAHYLQRLGIGADARVGVCIEQSTELIAALLSVLKAGAAYVPLDPTYPPERLRFMLEDAQVSVLLTQQSLAPLFKTASPPVSSSLQIVCLDQVWEAIAQEPEANRVNRATADSLAYVIYTSGSTGTPKGVAIPHHAVNRLVCHTNYVKLTASDRIAQISNISFDAATFEIWGALLNGARLVGIRREVTLSPTALVEQIQQQQISVLFLTTALLNQLASEVPTAFTSLRYLLFGGEAVDPKWVRAILAQGAPRHLLHVYGPTESTTFASAYEVQHLSEAATTIPIGRAIANTQLYILDTHLNPVPVGVKGELYIGGDGLAQGYLNRPELTAERFIQHPLIQPLIQPLVQPSIQSLVQPLVQPSIQPSTRQLNGIEQPESRERLQSREQPQDTAPTGYLYRTGDLARYVADGNIEFLGRVDDQVKIRGFRIELGEIEAVLHQHPAIQRAIAQVQTRSATQADSPTDQRLVAYIVSRQNPPPDARELREFLQAKLPDFMVPSAFAMLETVPLTPNGKVNRRALPAITWVSHNSAECHQPPQTPVEQTLATVWTQLLGVQQVGIHDNFFELGGHSLLATQLMSRVRDRLQVEVPLHRLFETPTIAGLATYIETMSWVNHGFQMDHAACSTTLKREEVEF